VIVAVVTVKMVEVIADAIIDMISVGHGLVPTSRTMPMGGIVVATGVTGSAAVRVGACNFDHVLIDMILMRVVQVAIMQIVDVASMAYGGMTAVGAVLMGMVGMGVMGTTRHGLSSSSSSPSSADTASRSRPSAA
jgi:hypothetical protein